MIITVKDNGLDLDGERVEKIRVSQKGFQEKSWKIGCGFNIEMDDTMETWCSLLGLVTSRCLRDIKMQIDVREDR